MALNIFYVKYALTALLFAKSLQNVFSQQNSTIPDVKNTFYVEFVNTGALYSFNYVNVFARNKKTSWSYRAGIGYRLQKPNGDFFLRYLASPSVFWFLLPTISGK